MKLTKELEEQLTKFFKSLSGDEERKPWMRYWGGPIEELYELVTSKYNIAVDNTCNFYDAHADEKNELKPEFKEEFEQIANVERMYNRLIDVLRECYPQLKGWSREMIGPCGTRIC